MDANWLNFTHHLNVAVNTVKVFQLSNAGFEAIMFNIFRPNNSRVVLVFVRRAWFVDRCQKYIWRSSVHLWNDNLVLDYQKEERAYRVS